MLIYDIKADVKAFAELGFQPSFSLVARPSFYKLLEPCRGVGYDSTYTSSSHEWIANFNTGWSDGLARKLSNCGHVLRIKTGKSIHSGLSSDDDFFETNNVKY
ncbi:hypothetical protein HAZT_HAZT002960 [Hyalella azteca]|uniref:Alanine racemase C-terminal domain-containing protein n=1 Tax=Hyalella azteca TaxID=294128 RepID=A0A6A0GPM5_HYAAZ|nr:hypothetical protein HAZT_HAZT002960 [Hyalella azteca]